MDAFKAAPLLRILGMCFVATTFGYDPNANPPRIYFLHIRSDVQFRFATTLVSSRVVNPVNHSQEVAFEVTLPDEAFISNFTMEIDGEVFPGVVKDKDEAKRDYDQAKRRGQSAGHIAQKPRDTSRFKIKVLIAAHSKVFFNLTYQELLKRVKGAYEHRIYIDVDQPVEDFQVSVAILESRDITKIHVPPIRALNHLLTNSHLEAEQTNPLAVVERPLGSKRQAFVTFAPSTTDQQNGYSTGQFVVQYEVENALDAGDVLVVNGYFVHFLAPAVQRPIPKDVMFVLDVSGSMSGTKMVQLKEAMFSILDELRETDRFNIITFDDKITLYKPNMTDVTKKDIFEANVWIKEEVYADGWTDINAGMLRGIDLLKEFQEEDERSPVILFLTDGQPSHGVQNDVEILANIQRANEGGIPVFSLAFGNDADFTLVKRMAIQNDGLARKIYEDSDADLQISGFYGDISATLLNNITVKYLEDEVDAGSVTKSNFRNYFQGSELVVAGKLKDPAADTISLEVLGDSVDGNIVLAVDGQSNVINAADTNLMQVGDFETITEKLWAYMTIKQLLRQASVAFNATATDILKQRVKEIALQYGFVTSMTSMVVVKPDIIDDRPTTPAPPTTTRRYYGGGGGGGYSGGGGGDPHYLVRVGTLEHPLCFDVKSGSGVIHNLINDPKNNVVINAQIIASGKLGNDGLPKTFIGQISLETKHHVIVVTPDAILFDLKMYSWHEERIKLFGGHELMTLDSGRSLVIKFKFGAEVYIKRHMRHANATDSVNYLNTYVTHEDGFSKSTTGLIGQFVNGQKRITLIKEYDRAPSGKHIAKLRVREGPKFLNNADSGKPVSDKPVSNRVTANLIEKSEIIIKGTEKCWMVHKKFERTLLGDESTWVTQNFVSA